MLVVAMTWLVPPTTPVPPLTAELSPATLQGGEAKKIEKAQVQKEGELNFTHK